MLALIVQGEDFLRASREVDINITLGDAVCVLESLADNRLDCRPPTNKPNSKVNDTFCRGDLLSLRASSHSLCALQGAL